MIAQVLVELKAKNIDQTYSYLIPSELEAAVKVGIRVLVPFGNQKLEGFVLKIEPIRELEFKMKSILEVIDEYPVINEEMLELGKYISKKTLCNLIHAYQTMLPTALKAKKGKFIPKKYVTYIYLVDSNYKTTSKPQNEILDILKKKKMTKKEAADISASALKTLIKNHVVEEELIETYRMINEIEKEKKNIDLTEQQKQVLNQIVYNQFQPYLLYGVTGSGKTEVYMNVIETVIKNKQEAIVLVPEISLTPQLVDIFKKRFGSEIAILHSRLSDGEKYDEWRKIERKEVKIAIGARSAIFAPFTNLGVIIIDEEHSTTYKQENTPKYHAIDVALWRAKKYNIPVILGSATPSIESYTRANMGVYTLCTMKERVNHNLPIVELIDMREEMKKGNRIFSDSLRTKIKERIAKDEQVILLLNRRGYTTVMTCKNCGYTHKCPNCDIPLTYHKTSNTMRCHYCGHGDRILKQCPECDSEKINGFGMGTEKLEQYVQEQFEGAKVIRMDVDTTTAKGSHEKIIQSFRKKEYNVLIGTQMIAKGLDFEDVTLVGVINGDASLNIPDFRSAERTFQLLNQVAGRAGRSTLKGEVVIQGFNIDHYSIVKASKHDYVGFYEEELNLRKILKYSPYFNLCLIKIKSADYEKAMEEGKKIVGHFNQFQNKDLIVLGPSPGMIPKINQIYQIQIILKYKNTNQVMKELQFIQERYRTSKIIVDIDLNPIKL